MYINNQGHMTKMAAMPIYGINPSKIFFSGTSRLPSAPIFPIFSYIFRASYFFLYFDPKSYIFPSNSYIFQNAADNNEISRKNHGIWFEMPVLMSLAFFFFLRSLVT